MPIIHKGKISGILYLENNLTPNVFTPGRFELLQIISSQAAISIENARLLIHREEKAKLEKEIEIAEKIQRSLLPKKIPEIEEVLLAFKYIPMMGVGGDFVNIYHKKDAGESGKIGLFICDVSGHGIPAAMTASMVSNSLDFFWDTHFDSPSKILKEMSNSLKNKMGGNFFTGCICSMDLKEGTLIMSSAGHPPLLIIRKNGTIETKISKGSFITDFFESRLEDCALALYNGDTLVLYTDGITEARDPNGEMIGDTDEKFRAWIKRYYEMSSSPDELCENIYKGVVEHTQSDQLDDDFTVLVVKYRG
ncbi:MAG: SpoIIE family protein phosphatase [bacterium]|nr:SpoIIE family protein phosphatase [bacterium]